MALPDGWRWCSGDWAAWDFEHADGTRLEVKQSAARQTWNAPRNIGQRRFDVAPRKGRWQDGSVWVDEPGRYAHIYVFADHPVSDETADHCNPTQWLFFPVEASELPSARTLSLGRVVLLAKPCRYAQLATAIEGLRLRRADSRA